MSCVKWLDGVENVAFFQQSVSISWWYYYQQWVSLVAQMVKNLLTVQETWVRSLSWEDPLEEEMATLSNTLAWRILWAEKPSGL